MNATLVDIKNNADFVDINRSKAEFDAIYTKDDPRSYFSVLGSLDYMIPDIAAPITRQLYAAWSEAYGGVPTVLDVGCSYGINAAVHRYALSFRSLRARYARRELMTLEPREVIELDRHYFRSWPEVSIARMGGLDASAQAIRYATDVGLLDWGFVANLETELPTLAMARRFQGVDIILSTGAIGYITARTFEHLLIGKRRPWVISFALRMFPYAAIEATLAAHGLVTEKLQNAVFVQRRFRDSQEFEQCLATLAEQGVDTTEFEATGLLQAELYVSRPEEDVAAHPLDSLVTIVSGRNRATGFRYVHVQTDEGAQIGLEM